MILFLSALKKSETMLYTRASPGLEDVSGSSRLLKLLQLILETVAFAAAVMDCESYLGHGVYSDTGTVDLDLVGVHGGVGHQDLGILYPVWLPDPNALVQNVALIHERFLNIKTKPIIKCARLYVCYRITSAPSQL